MNEPLFRPQVVTENQTRWLGTVLLTPRLSFRLFTAFAILSAVAIVLLGCLASYTRKAHINGWLVPQQGLIRVYAPQAGVVTQLDVHEGEDVQQGVPLLRLSAELQSASLGATQVEIARQLAARRSSLVAEGLRYARLRDQQMQALAERLGTLRLEQEQLEREMELQDERIRLAKEAEKRHHQLRRRGLVADSQVQQAEEYRIEQVARRHALERSRLTTLQTRLVLESELNDLPLKSQAEVADIERRIAEVGQQLAEAEARREIVLTAPQSGTVTAIQVERGGSVKTALPLLSIVPDGATLEAHLFSPSRAVGFVQTGQRVLLRYQAYPYQKFGHYEGRVASIARSAVNPGELPLQLAGLTSLYGDAEPVYRIVVRLDRQTVTAYGRPMPLQPGMQLEADVLIDRRRLIEWVFDPLYTLTGKWNG